MVVVLGMLQQMSEPLDQFCPPLRRLLCIISEKGTHYQIVIHLELGFSPSSCSSVIQSSTSKSRWMMKLSLSEPVRKRNT